MTAWSPRRHFRSCGVFLPVLVLMIPPPSSFFRLQFVFSQWLKSLNCALGVPHPSPLAWFPSVLLVLLVHVFFVSFYFALSCLAVSASAGLALTCFGFYSRAFRPR